MGKNRYNSSEVRWRSGARLSVPLFLLIVLFCVVAVSAVCVWVYPSLQDYVAGNFVWNGIDGFSRDFNAGYADSLVDLSPSGSVLVSIPSLPYTEQDLAWIESYVSSGGAFIIMDDSGQGNQLLSSMAVSCTVSGKQLLDPLFCYRNKSFPRIVDFDPEVRMAGVDLIVLNHATVLEDVPIDNVLAWSSRASFLDLNGNGTREGDEPEGPFPVAARFAYRDGTIYVLADSSILLNSMLWRDDNKRFISYIMERNGSRLKPVVDHSHLIQSPLDVSKKQLNTIRDYLSHPYGLFLIVAAAFLVVYRFSFKGV